MSPRKSARPAYEPFEFTSGSPEDTAAIGQGLGRLLQPGDVVALEGELGSGKTTMVQGVAEGLGRNPQQVKSPTFVLVREYPGEPPLVHIDGYRLEGAVSAAWLDLELYLGPTKITLIEWADRFPDLLPEDRVTVAFAHVSANRRRMTFRASGARSGAMVDALRAQQPAPAAAAPEPQPEAD
jgi:tRNA threonylcarbamoyladenosine biosynthesis protein TsaE